MCDERASAVDRVVTMAMDGRASRREMIKRAAALGIGASALPYIPRGRSASAQSSGSRPAESEQTATPIKHFITLMQENHSFDNYFGTYPGADGIPPDVCMPYDPNDLSQGCIKPFPIRDGGIEDLEHNRVTHQYQYNNGKMDGFVYAFNRRGKDGTLVMGYYDERELPFHWNVADEYVLFDRFFTSAAGGSVRNHMYWVAGVGGVQNPEVDAIPKEGWGDIPTIFDLLEAKGVSWKFYVQNYDPTITYRSKVVGDRGSQVVWVPLVNYARYIDNPELFSHIVPLDEYFTDIVNGTLPAVCYMVPSGSSEHPPGSLLAGQRFIKKLLNALMSSTAWPSSAFTWTYDDWGGWYDHVKPPVVDAFGYGFRAPALMVSAHAKRGFIDNTELDFTSILKFIEHNWGLDPLAERDAKANNLLNAFDFDSPPRRAKILPSTRAAPPPPEPRRGVIYASYSSVLAVPSLLIGAALAATVRRRRGASR